MATNVAGRRYRTWYAMLLRLYPQSFRERFGEGMAKTFHDLCREHRDCRQDRSTRSSTAWRVGGSGSTQTRFAASRPPEPNG